MKTLSKTMYSASSRKWNRNERGNGNQAIIKKTRKMGIKGGMISQSDSWDVAWDEEGDEEEEM